MKVLPQCFVNNVKDHVRAGFRNQKKNMKGVCKLEKLITELQILAQSQVVPSPRNSASKRPAGAGGTSQSSQVTNV